MQIAYKNHKGFTLLEITVVIYIISLGLIGIMSLVNQNIQVSYINKNELIASQLAQEGLELVRNIRDSNWLKEYNWKNGNGTDNKTDIVQSDGSYNYTIDYLGNINESINSIDNARLYINGSGFYNHISSGTPTPFYRLIEVIDNSPPNDYYITVKATVRWKEKNRTHDYMAQTLLYNWRYAP